MSLYEYEVSRELERHLMHSLSSRRWWPGRVRGETLRSFTAFGQTKRLKFAWQRHASRQKPHAQTWRGCIPPFETNREVVQPFHHLPL